MYSRDVARVRAVSCVSLPECFGLRASGLPAFVAIRVAPARSPHGSITVYELLRGSGARGAAASFRHPHFGHTPLILQPKRPTSSFLSTSESIVWDNNRATIEGVLDEVRCRFAQNLVRNWRAERKGEGREEAPARRTWSNSPDRTWR